MNYMERVIIGKLETRSKIMVVKKVIFWSSINCQKNYKKNFRRKYTISRMGAHMHRLPT